MEFLKNYNEFIACYKTIDAVLYRSNYVLNEEFFYLIRKEPVDTTLLFCSSEARSEIINQLSINNNGRVSLAKRMSIDNQQIDHVLNKIVKNNKIFTELEDVDSLCGIESDICQFYIKMIVYKKRVYEGIEYYFDSAIRKELYQEPSQPQSATKTPESQSAHGNRQSSYQNIEDRIEAYSKLFDYLNEFSNEGIEFNVFNAMSNQGEDRLIISHDGSGNVDRMIDLANKGYQEELIDRFYRRKWQDYNVRWSADMFAKRELKRLSEFSSFLTGGHDDLFNDLRHYLDCRRFLTEEDMAWLEPISPATEQYKLKNYKDFVTTFSMIGLYLKREGYILNKETISWINQPHISDKLFECANKAYNEIENLLIINNNGRLSLINKLNGDIQAICNILDNLIKSNPIITKTESAIDSDRKTIINNLCGIDSDIFVCYTDLMVYYNLCYESIAKLGEVNSLGQGSDPESEEIKQLEEGEKGRQEDTKPGSVDLQSTEGSKTRDSIKETIEDIHKDKWEYFFKEESDYIQFANVLADFLEGKEYALPEKHIILKRNSKTKMATVLAHFLREHRDVGPMNSDDAFFKTIKGLLHDFKDYSIKGLGEYLSRKPKL